MIANLSLFHLYFLARSVICFEDACLNSKGFRKTCSDENHLPCSSFGFDYQPCSIDFDYCRVFHAVSSCQTTYWYESCSLGFIGSGSIGFESLTDSRSSSFKSCSIHSFAYLNFTQRYCCCSLGSALMGSCLNCC